VSCSVACGTDHNQMMSACDDKRHRTTRAHQNHGQIVFNQSTTMALCPSPYLMDSGVVYGAACFLPLTSPTSPKPHPEIQATSNVHHQWSNLPRRRNAYPHPSNQRGAF
jgi:hypothetical protein